MCCSSWAYGIFITMSLFTKQAARLAGIPGRLLHGGGGWAGGCLHPLAPLGARPGVGQQAPSRLHWAPASEAGSLPQLALCGAVLEPPWPSGARGLGLAWLSPCSARPARLPGTLSCSIRGAQSRRRAPGAGTPGPMPSSPGRASLANPCPWHPPLWARSSRQRRSGSSCRQQSPLLDRGAGRARAGAWLV